jgi:hypothetical protein
MHNIDINNDGMPTQKKNNINKFDVVLMNSNIEHPNTLVMGRRLRRPSERSERLKLFVRSLLWLYIYNIKINLITEKQPPFLS